jgi:hypothetical protein
MKCGRYYSHAHRGCKGDKTKKTKKSITLVFHATAPPTQSMYRGLCNAGLARGIPSAIFFGVTDYR